MAYPTSETILESIPNITSAELVQTGGQKAVFKATIDGQPFALKLLRLSTDAGDERSSAEIDTVTARAEREVNILAQVDVPVLACGGPVGLSMIESSHGKWLYFTEEWIEGTCLREMIRESRFSPPQVAQLGIDLIHAVCWLSSRGLIHRDIKPPNVIYATERSRFVLLDPGIAFDVQGTSLTLGPFPVGTVAYVSPEQMDVARKRRLDFRSDLFAVGIVMYEAALGEHPFRRAGTSLSQLLAGILGANPVPIAERIEGFPMELSDFINRLLGKQPHLRFRTCALAQTRIQNIAEALGELE